MNKWKIFLVIGSLITGFFVLNSNVLAAGCCKKIELDTGNYKVEFKRDVRTANSKDECEKFCNNPLATCGTWFTANKQISLGSLSCLNEDGCCQIEFTQSNTLAYFGSSQDECDLYCSAVTCTSKYEPGKDPDKTNKKCVGGANQPSGCCKIIDRYNLDWLVETIEKTSASDCDNYAKNYTKGTRGAVGSFRANVGVNSGAKACSPEKGCCELSTNITNQKGSYYSNSEDECEKFCWDEYYKLLPGCNYKYYDKYMPDSKWEKCTVDPSKVTKTPTTPITVDDPAEAVATVKLNSVQLTNPISADTIPAVIANIIKSFLGIIGAIALAMFVYGGFRWLTAAGNDKSIQAGRDTLLWAGIGLILIFLSYIAVGYVMQVLGVI